MAMLKLADESSLTAKDARYTGGMSLPRLIHFIRFPSAEIAGLEGVFK